MKTQTTMVIEWLGVTVLALSIGAILFFAADAAVILIARASAGAAL